MAITLGSRFGLTRWGAGTDPLRRSQLDTNDALLESLAAIYGQGLLASRPAAGVAGRFWIVNGEVAGNAPLNGQLWYDNGTAWVQPLAAQQVPPGSYTPTFATVLPAGWLWMNGQQVNKDAYVALYTAIGDVGGNSTATLFAIPDLRGRAPVGLDNLGGAADAGVLNLANTLGLKFGEQLHTTITAELPSHSHTGGTGFVSSDHTHTVASHAHAGGTGGQNANHNHTASLSADVGTSAAAPTSAQRRGGSYIGQTTGVAQQDHAHAIGAEAPGTGGISANHSHAFTTDAAGSGTPHNVMGPSILSNWIIKT